MPRVKKDGLPNRELRIVLSPEAYARIHAQADLMDQNPSSFSRQIIMEKVTALEAANSQRFAGDMYNLMKREAEKMEEKDT